jgi:hypothetical protein
MKLQYLGVTAILIGCSGSDTKVTPPPPPAPPGPRTITAHDAETWRAADGSINPIATDLDRAVVQAIVRADDGTWSTYPGVGLLDGTIVIADVPAGDAIVRVDYYNLSPEAPVRNEYFWVGGDGDVDLDLGTWRAGRTDARIAQTSPTDLELDMSGLVPWQTQNDSAVIYEPNLGFVNFFMQDIGTDITGMPADNATAAQLHVDWVHAVYGPLAEESKGDRAYLMQFRWRTMSGVVVGAPVSATELPPFSQIDGQPTAVPSTVTSTPTTQVRVAMDRDAFDRFRPAISPAAGPASDRGFNVFSTPGDVATDFSSSSLPAELVSLSDSTALAGTGLFDVGDIDVVSPFPASSMYAQYESIYPVTTIRDDGHSSTATAEIGVITNQLPTQAAPAAPIISPVQGVTVGGKDAFSSPKGVGLTPTIAWQPPALGTPLEYEVRVLGPGGADPTYGFLWYPAATFHVPGTQTSLQVPAETLVAGFPYSIAIRAITEPLTADEHAAAPRKLALPYGWADTLTPEFKP